ncbi:4733_t:CDS:2 [Rhizophagus irregularis]|nr:4733_t:CDS:2 [Rhizophagus irregularis]
MVKYIISHNNLLKNFYCDKSGIRVYNKARQLLQSHVQEGNKAEKFILKQSKEKKKVHFKFKSTNISPSQKSNDVSDGGEELYFDAMDQNVNMDEMPATAVTQIQSTSSSHIGNSREKFEEISTLNVLAKRLPSRPLASTKS